MQDAFVREVYVEGHCGCGGNDICAVFLLQALVENLHVQQAQEPANTSEYAVCDLKKLFMHHSAVPCQFRTQGLCKHLHTGHQCEL